jgi:sensor histidine kinase regulating citrate/malate metabolism
MENSKSNINIDFLVFAGFFMVNIITFMLLEYEKKIYNRQLENEKILFNVTRSRTETEAAKIRYMETEKKRHEINRILGTIINLLDAGDVGKAKELLEEFDINHMVSTDSETYTYNIVLNSLLNQKITECKNNGIDVNCFVSGDINGIQDIDLHILVGNLLDNSMEAVEKSDRKYISIFIYSSDTVMEIKISNTTDLEIVKNNLKFESTKKESGHGYGILNVKDVVAKYRGEIIYNMVSDDIIQCRVVLIKNKSIQVKN